jgi:hypothetical protein
MATFTELKDFIKGIKPTTEAIIDGKTFKGQRLKSYLISKLTYPGSVDLSQPETKPTDKPSKKDK